MNKTFLQIVNEAIEKKGNNAIVIPKTNIIPLERRTKKSNNIIVLPKGKGKEKSKNNIQIIKKDNAKIIMNDDSTHIILNKMERFYPYINLMQIQKKYFYEIICDAYEGDRMDIGSSHKYCIKYNGHYKMYIDDVLIHPMKELKIEFNDDEIDSDFIFDIFHLFPEVEIYSYETNVCKFHKNRESSQYGGKYCKYTRIAPNIIQIDYSPSCCNYSGYTSIYDLNSQQYLY